MIVFFPYNNNENGTNKKKDKKQKKKKKKNRFTLLNLLDRTQNEIP